MYGKESGSEYCHRGQNGDLYLKDKINMHNNPDKNSQIVGVFED